MALGYILLLRACVGTVAKTPAAARPLNGKIEIKYAPAAQAPEQQPEHLVKGGEVVGPNHNSIHLPTHPVPAHRTCTDRQLGIGSRGNKQTPLVGPCVALPFEQVVGGRRGLLSLFFFFTKSRITQLLVALLAGLTPLARTLSVQVIQ